MISIIIPVYNQHEITKECLEAIKRNTKEKYEVVLIDNGSTPEINRDDYGMENLTILRLQENIGYPRAVNYGIGVSKGDIIILLNNDVIVTPNWDRVLGDCLAQEFDIVGPVTNYVAGLQKAHIFSYHDTEELDQNAVKWQKEYDGESTEVNFIIGFCMAFNRSLYETLGPLDESFWPCTGEDIDFCFRARSKDYKVGIARDLYVHHEGSCTFHALEEENKLNYKTVCKTSDRNIASKWGDGFWNRQAIEKESKEGEPK